MQEKERKGILTATGAEQKLKRLAYEIAEHNADEKELVLAGIAGNGELLAAKLQDVLKTIMKVPVLLLTISINKKNPLDARFQEGTDLNEKVVIVVDDVSNTGRTLLYALKPVLSFLPRKIQSLVLVERSHKLYAIQPDFVGLSLATTMQEHIVVEMKGKEIAGAFLE
jgi:pyrimidine operon attenuation protein/uracil phosphoribosyltransferase